jgi:hypothetical protein
MHYAAQRGFHETLVLLFSWGGKGDLMCKNGYRPVVFAVVGGYLKCVKLIHAHCPITKNLRHRLVSEFSQHEEITTYLNGLMILDSNHVSRSPTRMTLPTTPTHEKSVFSRKSTRLFNQIGKVRVAGHINSYFAPWPYNKK